MEKLEEFGRRFLLLPLTPSCVSSMRQFIDIFLLEIDKRIVSLLRSRVNVDLIMTSLRLMFEGELLIRLMKSGHEYLLNSNDALLVFSKDGYSSSCCAYMTGILEYMCSDILQLSETEAQSQQQKQITPYNLVKGLQDDPEWSPILTRLNFRFLLPFVHPRDYNRTKKSILNIQTKQKLVIPYDPFATLVKSILKEESADTKISKKSVELLQHYVENELVQFLIDIRKQHRTTKIASKHLLC